MSKLIFDQDTQKGLLLDKSIFAVPNIERVLISAMRNEVLVASSTYYDEFVEYEKLSETIIVTDELYYNVPITRHGIDMNLADNCYQVNFEKLGNDIWDEEEGQPDNFMTFLRTNEVDTVYIIGNNYEGNVLDTYLGLTKSKYKVVVVEDAVINLTDFVRDKLTSFGKTHDNLRIITTNEAIGELSE